MKIVCFLNIKQKYHLLFYILLITSSVQGKELKDYISIIGPEISQSYSEEYKTHTTDVYYESKIRKDWLNRPYIKTEKKGGWNYTTHTENIGRYVKITGVIKNDSKNSVKIKLILFIQLRAIDSFKSVSTFAIVDILFGDKSRSLGEITNNAIASHIKAQKLEIDLIIPARTEKQFSKIYDTSTIFGRNRKIEGITVDSITPELNFRTVNSILYVGNKKYTGCRKVPSFYHNFIEEACYRNGKKHGKQKTWYNNQLTHISNYKNGKQDGNSIYYHSNGKKEDSGVFINGKLNGIRKTWYETGSKKCIYKYQMGKEIDKKCYEDPIEKARKREEERKKAEKIKAEKIKAERIKAERIKAERLEAERIEAERIEAERIEAERIEAERIEAERIEAERLEKLRKEKLNSSPHLSTDITMAKNSLYWNLGVGLQLFQYLNIKLYREMTDKFFYLDAEIKYKYKLLNNLDIAINIPLRTLLTSKYKSKFGALPGISLKYNILYYKRVLFNIEASPFLSIPLDSIEDTKIFIKVGLNIHYAFF